MKSSFNSKFSADIKGMMEWRGVLGYTESCYEYEMKKFDQYCLEHFPDEDVLTWNIVLTYLTELRKSRDVRVDIAAIRNLGKFQVQKGKSACVFPAGYFSHKKRKLPYIMSKEETRRFFKATDNYPRRDNNPLTEYTAPVIFRLQFSCGMRPQEVRLLKRQDFDFKNGTVYIADSKRHKDRCIAVDQRIMDMCGKYDGIARSMYPGTEFFFPNKDNEGISNESLTKMFHRCWSLAGNPENIEYCTPYILRHNYATQTIMRWTEEGKDLGQYLPYLSVYMGHETFHSTLYYFHLIPERIAKMDCMNMAEVIPEVE